MFNTKFLRIVIITLIVIGGTLFTSCYGSSPFSGNTIVFSIPEEENTIDPALNSSLYAGTLIENSFEGIVKVDSNQKIKPGVAEKWELSEDGRTYTFYFRKNAVWSDDKPVITDNFKFAWERILNKETKSPYASYAMCIKGAKDFYEGKTKDLEGVELIDDYTMKITLENPTHYFLDLIASHPFMPVREDVVKYKNWSKDPEKYISNGPLNLKSLVPNESMSYERNTHYWNEKEVKLDKLEVKIIPDSKEALNQFKIGKVDYLEEVFKEDAKELINTGKAERVNISGTCMYEFNMSKDLKQKNPELYKVLNDKNIRHALSISINRDYIVKNILQGGEKPANSIISPGITDSKGNEFKSKNYFSTKGDVKKAKKLLAEAGYPEGKGFPELRLLYNKSMGHDKVAKYVKETWKKKLGIDIKLIEKGKMKVLEDAKNGNFDIVKKGWAADYNDPSTFFKLFESDVLINSNKYSNAEIDLLLEKVHNETDENKRIELYHKMEDIIMEEMPIIPVYNYVNTVCINPKVKGVTKSRFGNIIFYTGYKENKVS